MYVCTYIDIHTYIHTCIYINRHAHSLMPARMYENMHKYSHTHTWKHADVEHMFMRTYICKYIIHVCTLHANLITYIDSKTWTHTCIHTYIHTRTMHISSLRRIRDDAQHIHTYIYVCTHTYIHIHTYTCMHISVPEIYDTYIHIHTHTYICMHMFSTTST